MQRQLWAGAQRPSTGGSRSPSKTNLTEDAQTDKLDTARPNIHAPQGNDPQNPLYARFSKHYSKRPYGP